VKLSIVVPAYNEATRIVNTLKETCVYLDANYPDYELIVVDDGSQDETVNVADKQLAGIKGTGRVICNATNHGKGFVVKQGVLEAKGDIVAFMDADLATPIAEIDKLVRAIEAGADVAIGSRALADSDVQLTDYQTRSSMGKIFNLIARFLTFHDIADSQCGFKAFSRDVARKLFVLQRIPGFAFDAEILFLAQKQGYQVQEIPIVWRNMPQSKVSIWKDPLLMIRDLLRIRLYHW